MYNTKLYPSINMTKEEWQKNTKILYGIISKYYEKNKNNVQNENKTMYEKYTRLYNDAVKYKEVSDEYVTQLFNKIEDKGYLYLQAWGHDVSVYD